MKRERMCLILMPAYSDSLTVDIHDVDSSGICRGSALLRYIQSAAQRQLNERGLSYDRLKEQKRAFLLSRIAAEFSEPVHAYEPLIASTFPCESRGFSFLRCYTLARPDGDVIGRAMGVFALIDTESHALVRVNDFPLGLSELPPLDLSLNAIRMPDLLRPLGTYHVGYGVTDQNGHMNNTCYPDLYADFLPMNGRRIAKLSIHFRKEAPCGENLSVSLGEQDGKYYFRTVREDGEINTDAEIRLAPL